jgi:hypothetical protein
VLVPYGIPSLFSGLLLGDPEFGYLSLNEPTGAYPKFISQGLNNDYLPIWLQEGGINTYYVGKFSNGHSIDNYQTTPAKGWTNTK